MIVNRDKDQAWRSGVMQSIKIYLFPPSGNHQWGRVGEWHTLRGGGGVIGYAIRNNNSFILFADHKFLQLEY